MVSDHDNLSSVLFGKTRRAVLSLLFSRPDAEFYTREILRSAKAGHGAVQRELDLLTRTGILRRSVRGNQVLYRANPKSPAYGGIKELVLRTTGFVPVLRAALAPLSDRIRLAFIFGSVASGNEDAGSDIDVLVVGDTRFTEVVAALQDAQDKLGREVNPTVYSAAEFRSRLAEGHYFLTNVIEGPHQFLVGDEHELARLAGQGLADRA